mgnify:CR=1 FL=1
MNLRAVRQPDGSVNLTGVQGKTWVLQLSLTQDTGAPLDISGWVVRGQIRRTYKSDAVVATWECSVEDGPGGKVFVMVKADDTAKIPCGNSANDALSKYVYDIEAQDPTGYVLELLRGRLFVLPEVTR